MGLPLTHYTPTAFRSDIWREQRSNYTTIHKPWTFYMDAKAYGWQRVWSWELVTH